jgi:2-dehydro-3-deoxygalactonokinase
VSTVPFLVAVDWGTSSFRLWLMSADGTVLAEHRSHEGMSEVASGFETVLEAIFRACPYRSSFRSSSAAWPDHGRAGWRPAISTPPPTSPIRRNATLCPEPLGEIIIVPGLAVRSLNEPDVMRGEETQLLGAHLDMPEAARYCMPGTHSKWVTMRGLVVTGFETYMTGELFSVATERRFWHSTGGEGPVDARAIRLLQTVCATAGHGPN